MIDLVKGLFGKTSQGGRAAQREEKPRDTAVATCALLLEMANIDGEFSRSERDNIISILKRDFRLSDEHAAQLLEASEKELKQSVDLWQFTNLINENYTLDEKTRVIEMVWKIVYTDDRLNMHEDYLVHKLANLLRLPHKQLVDAKLKVLHGDP